ncbi:hypothetical protein [Candidiatus Paracoxiella cheracis]|uniref:hypothetical protein n=1 Tax=Candidiatus Paracoxiella cheracis TaxID=3405120 RepID=UPI003BF4E107
MPSGKKPASWSTSEDEEVKPEESSSDAEKVLGDLPYLDRRPPSLNSFGNNINLSFFVSLLPDHDSGDEADDEHSDDEGTENQLVLSQ